jgi:uncharacterized heparinase superfamily protein
LIHPGTVIRWLGTGVKEAQWRIGWAWLYLHNHKATLRIGSRNWQEQPLTDPWKGDATNGRKILEGTFTSNRHMEVLDEELWERTHSLSSEWLKQLFSFAWLRDVEAAQPSESDLENLRGFFVECLTRRYARKGITRHADIAAERLAHCLAHHAMLLEDADDKFIRLLLRDQLQTLRRLESIRRRNGYRTSLSVLKGLVFGALSLQAAGFLLGPVMRTLEEALQNRFLRDGGHLSRSPGWHLEETRLLMEIRQALQQRGLISSYEFLDQVLAHALDALATLTHSDGKLALFNDSIEIDTSELQRVWQSWRKAVPQAMPVLENMHFVRLQQAASVVIMDVGAPKARLSRSFFGTLSFEFSSGEERIIVNCGGSRGSNLLWRKACKATAAHSTLTVDDENSWQPADQARHTLIHKPEVTSQMQDGRTMLAVDAAYNGYVPFAGLLHYRKLMLSQEGAMLEGLDVLTGHDAVVPQETHRVRLRFHLHPAITILRIARGMVDFKTPRGKTWRFETLPEFAAGVEESVYLGEGGQPKKSLQITIESLISREMDLKIPWKLIRQAE